MVINMTLAKVKLKIDSAEKNGGLSPDDKIELSEQLTTLMDEVDEQFTRLSLIEEVIPEPEGKRDPKDVFIENLMDQQTKPILDISDIKKKYSISELKKLATKNKINGRSKLTTEDQLIEALLKAGVAL